MQQNNLAGQVVRWEGCWNRLAPLPMLAAIRSGGPQAGSGALLSGRDRLRTPRRPSPRRQTRWALRCPA